MDPITLSAAASAVTGAGQGILGLIQNKKNREFAEKQTNQARQWALEDWQSQNEYNSPRAQMQRLQEAGLNPNLVYGTGAATAQAQPVRQTQPQSYKGETPDFSGLQNSLFTGVDLQAKKAQIDLLETQKTVAINNAALLAQKSASEAIRQSKDTFVLDNAKKLQAGSLQMQQLSLNKLSQEIDLGARQFQLSLNEDERRTLSNTQSIKESIQKIAESKSRTWLNQFEGAKKQAETDKIRKTISLMNQDTEVRELDLRLKREGLQPSDPTWQRVIMQQMKKWFPDLF